MGRARLTITVDLRSSHKRFQVHRVQTSVGAVENRAIYALGLQQNCQLILLLFVPSRLSDIDHLVEDMFQNECA